MNLSKKNLQHKPYYDQIKWPLNIKDECKSRFKASSIIAALLIAGSLLTGNLCLDNLDKSFETSDQCDAIISKVEQNPEYIELCNQQLANAYENYSSGKISASEYLGYKEEINSGKNALAYLSSTDEEQAEEYNKINRECTHSTAAFAALFVPSIALSGCAIISTIKAGFNGKSYLDYRKILKDSIKHEEKKLSKKEDVMEA